MAARTPVYYNSSTGDLLEANPAEMTRHYKLAIYRFASDVTPEVVKDQNEYGGTWPSIGTMTDTRLQAGAAGSDNTNFDTAAELDDVSTISTVFELFEVNRGNSKSAAGSIYDELIDYPIYLDADNNLRAMDQDDFIDTFIAPAFERMSLADPTDSADYDYLMGTFWFFDENAPALVVDGYTFLKYYLTPVFTNTVADIDAYTADGLPEDQDQPDADLEQDYYMYFLRRQETTRPTEPLHIDTDGNLRAYTEAEWNTIVQRHARWYADSVMSYTISGGENGTTAGKVMGDTIVDQAYDSSQVLQNQVGDDYRSQEVPAGTLQVVNSYTLKLNVQ